MKARELKLHDLDLNLLVLFDSLMTTGHLTQAAKHLGVTQSAASQALGRLRRTFDDVLFVRTQAGMVPTARARALAKNISPGLAQIASGLRERTAFDPHASERIFRLAFGGTHEPSLLPPLLRTLLGASSTIGIASIPGTPEEALERVRRADVDLALDYDKAREAALSHGILQRETMVVIARKGHPRVGQRIGIRRFFAERHVVLSVTDERRAIIEERFQHGSHRRQVMAEVSHYASVPPLVLQSDAIATVPRSLADMATHGGCLEVLPHPLRLPALPVYAIWHRAHESDPAHTFLRQTLGLLR